MRYFELFIKKLIEIRNKKARLRAKSSYSTWVILENKTRKLSKKELDAYYLWENERKLQCQKSN